MATKKNAPASKVEPAKAADAPVEEPKAKPKYAENDNSIDARMWRLNQDHIRMGSRQPE